MYCKSIYRRIFCKHTDSKHSVCSSVLILQKASFFVAQENIGDAGATRSAHRTDHLVHIHLFPMSPSSQLHTEHHTVFFWSSRSNLVDCIAGTLGCTLNSITLSYKTQPTIHPWFPACTRLGMNFRIPAQCFHFSRPKIVCLRMRSPSSSQSQLRL